jgi:nicotinamidase-related amidase
MKNYPSESTAILIVDPFNDFLSEGGKLWSSTKETVSGVNLIENLKNIVAAARSSGTKIVYVPHRQTEKGGLLRLEIPGAYTPGSLKYSMFEK